MKMKFEMNRQSITSIVLFVLCAVLLCATYLGMQQNLHHVVNRSDESIPDKEPKNDLCIRNNICKDGSESFYKYSRIKSFVETIKRGKTSSNPRGRIPKIIHFAYYTGKNSFFRFHEYVSIKAAFLDVDIFFWYDFIPFGENWIKLTEEVKSLKLIHRSSKRLDNGTSPISESDRVRVEAVMEYGGIGLDLDIVILKPLTNFYKNNVTVAAISNTILPDIIIARPWSAILIQWYQGGGQTSVVSFLNQHKNSIRIEKHLISPENRDLMFLYGESGEHQTGDHHRLDKVIAVKLWFSDHKIEHGLKDIEHWQCLVGELFRNVTKADTANR